MGEVEIGGEWIRTEFPQLWPLTHWSKVIDATLRLRIFQAVVRVDPQMGYRCGDAFTDSASIVANENECVCFENRRKIKYQSNQSSESVSAYTYAIDLSSISKSA